MEAEQIPEATPEGLPEESSIASRLGDCEVCNIIEAKYTCPKCEVKTCSLRCNKIHKLELECDGNRDKTKYVALNRFSNMDFENDFKLLENITDRLDAIKKQFGRRRTSTLIPVHLFKLRNAAQLRNTTLKFLPYKFVRHRNNTSYLNFKTKIIHWHIDWVFVNANNLRLFNEKVVETDKVGSILMKHLNNQPDKTIEEELKYYQAKGLAGVKLLLKAEQKGARKFYELDPSLSLKQSFSKKLIIEYPTIHVVFKDHGDGFDVIDSDDEDSTTTSQNSIKTGNQKVEHILRRAESDESLYWSLKNLLFISEYSDEDNSD